jgi:hypothetical protein
MIKDPAISVKWSVAINNFEVKTDKDADILQEFRSWYLKAKTIQDVPQPYRSWVEKGLPAKHRSSNLGTVTPKFSVIEDED